MIPILRAGARGEKAVKRSLSRLRDAIERRRGKRIQGGR
jgi:hypothetical protein